MAESAQKQLVLTSTPDARTIRQRFMALNHDRLKLLHQSLRKRQRMFVEVLPFLFHINHPALPGFVSKDTPFGMSDYSPTQAVINNAKQINMEFYYERRAMHTYQIQALYMIGSSGTIAHNSKSDFDIWVCHRPGMDEKGIHLLQGKCDLIRTWAETLSLEVTFFVMDANQFRDGKMSALSNESSGSAQFHILLEEFYRTGLLLAGKYPSWWLVPPDLKEDYRVYLRRLHESRQIPDYEHLDFGNLVQIPATEFFGAALWQLNKAVNSPHKSLLKLLLIEAYASEYPNMELLCTRYKRAVYDGSIRLDKIDPYVMMCNKVEDYLLGIKEYERCELARRCFYFKIGKSLSNPGRYSTDERFDLMMSIARGWNWGQDVFVDLDARNSWKIERVLREKASIVKELTRSYHMLSEFARTNTSEFHISGDDINLLGRRLYAAFERKAGKIELVNPDISTNLTEARLRFVIHQVGERVAWLLYNTDSDETIENRVQPIKHAATLIELVIWAYFNGILGAPTLVTLHNSVGVLDARELLSIIDTLRDKYPGAALDKPGLEQMKKPSVFVDCLAYVNFGEDPLHSHTQRGVHLTTNRTDAFSFSGLWKNLVNSFDMFIINSWGEILTVHLEGPNAAMDCLTEYFGGFPLDNTHRPAAVQVYSFSSTRGGSIAKRVAQLFSDVGRVFYETSLGEYIRYCVNVGSDYYVLESEQAKLRYTLLHSEDELIAELGKAQNYFAHIIFDRYTLRTSPLPTIVKYNKPNRVQLFYEIREQDAYVWILDARGSLFYQVLPFHTKEMLLSQCASILNKTLQSATQHPASNVTIEYYAVQKNRFGKYAAQLLDNPANAV